VKVLKIKKIEVGCEEFNVLYCGKFYRGIQKCRRYPGGKWLRRVRNKEYVEVGTDIKKQLEEMYEIEAVWKNLEDMGEII